MEFRIYVSLDNLYIKIIFRVSDRDLIFYRFYILDIDF